MPKDTVNVTQSQDFNLSILNPEPTLQKLQCTEYDERYFMTLEPGLGRRSNLQTRKEGHENQSRGNNRNQSVEAQCLRIIEQCI